MSDEPSKAAEAPESPPAEEKKAAGGNTRTRTLVTAGAIGIGSAALVAALLYANRSRGKGGKA